MTDYRDVGSASGSGDIKADFEQAKAETRARDEFELEARDYPRRAALVLKEVDVSALDDTGKIAYAHALAAVALAAKG